MGLSLPVCIIQISRSVYLPQVLTYYFCSCSISCLCFCSSLGWYSIQCLLGLVISSFELTVLQPALYHQKALFTPCLLPHMPSPRLFICNRGSLASNTNLQVTEAGIHPVTTYRTENSWGERRQQQKGQDWRSKTSLENTGKKKVEK